MFISYSVKYVVKDFTTNKRRVREKWLDMTNNKQISSKCHVEDYSVLCNEN